MTLTIGSMFSGMGGLDLAVEAVTGAEPAWFCEWDDAPSKVLAHHWPTVPNFRDVTQVDWEQVPRVDILTGGYPCQPFSHAGRREGTNDDRHLWPYVREAIRVLRPRFAFLENVAGHRSLGFDRVLGDLAEDGADVWWTSLRASDIGAPHHRERLFIVASFTDPGRIGLEAGRPPGRQETEVAGNNDRERPLPDPLGAGWGERRGPAPGEAQSRRPHSKPDGRGDGVRWGQYAPAVRDGEMTNASAAESGPAEVLRDMRGGVLPQEVQRSIRGQNPIPEPKDMRTVMREQQEGSSGRFPQVEGATDSQANGMCDMPLDPESACTPQGQEPGEQCGGKPGHAVRELSSETSLGGGQGLPGIHNQEINWGPYTAAIRRWERTLRRPAPNPTEPNRNGKPRLNAAFAEYLMGLPEGHVTDVPDLSRADQLKMIGNGVCPQQGAAALRELIGMMEETI